MNDRFVSFLRISRWASVIVAVAYHLRFLFFVDYGAVEQKTAFTLLVYFITGLGHEAFAVFFVLDGMLAGQLLQRGRHGNVTPGADLLRHAGALYRPLLPGLALGACLDAAGLRFANGAGLYTAFPELTGMTLDASTLLGNLFMLQPFAVPNFGSNSMLFLLSYLFWCAVLLAAVVSVGVPGRPGTVLLRSVLAGLLVLLLPAAFLVWAAIWLCGVAAVLLGEAGCLKPPVLVAGAGLGAALALSRVLGIDTGLLPQPFGQWLAEGRFWLVGAAFAVLVLALYPARRDMPAGRRHAAPARSTDRAADRTASFTFFFHFPVMMLLVGLAADLMDRPLMQQPTAAGYGEFVLAAAATVAICVLAARASGGASKGRCGLSQA